MFIVILITAKNSTEANKLANALVKEKLVACANIVPKVNSVFQWQGKIEKCPETLLILKSRKSLLRKIIKRVKSLHSYSVPEVIALSILDGNRDYLNWVKKSTE